MGLLLEDSPSTELCGWCCQVGGTTWNGVRVFPTTLSVVLGVMLVFVVTKIAINYLFLHRERQNQKVIGDSAMYNTFNHHHGESMPIVPSTFASSSALSINGSDADDADLRRPLADFSSSEGSLKPPEGAPVPTVYHLEHLPKLITPKRAYPLRWFHFLYLVITAGWFLLQALVLLSSGGSPLVRLIDTLLYEGHALIDVTIIMVAFAPNDNKQSIITALVASVMIVGLTSTTSVFYSLSEDCTTCSFFFPAPEAFYTYVIYAIIYVLCLSLTYLPERVPHPRVTVRWWLWYLSSVYVMATIGSGIVYWAGQDVGYCLMNVLIVWYCLPYGPLLYYTVQSDSLSLSYKLEPSPETLSYAV
jgi:hypothetical protein